LRGPEPGRGDTPLPVPAPGAEGPGGIEETGGGAPEPGRRRAAVGSFLGSFANTLLVSLQAVLLVPFVLRTVGPAVYGAWLASGDLLNWIQVLDLGLPNLNDPEGGRGPWQLG
jgi:hypothetical protein